MGAPNEGVHACWSLSVVRVLFDIDIPCTGVVSYGLGLPEQPRCILVGIDSKADRVYSTDNQDEKELAL